MQTILILGWPCAGKPSACCSIVGTNRMARWCKPIYWLTDFPAAEVGPQSLFHMAKSRWEIENQGFNEAKNHHDLEHIRNHHASSLVIAWLVALLALTIERLYRLRYLDRGRHRVASSAQLLLTRWLNLSRPCTGDSS